jgi:hypothetical protein
LWAPKSQKSFKIQIILLLAIAQKIAGRAILTSNGTRLDLPTDPEVPGFDSRCYQIFLEIVGLEQGPHTLVRIVEELLQGNSCSDLENRN